MKYKKIQTNWLSRHFFVRMEGDVFTLLKFSLCTSFNHIDSTRYTLFIIVFEFPWVILVLMFDCDYRKPGAFGAAAVSEWTPSGDRGPWPRP